MITPATDGEPQLYMLRSVVNTQSIHVCNSSSAGNNPTASPVKDVDNSENPGDASNIGVTGDLPHGISELSLAPLGPGQFLIRVTINGLKLGTV